MAVEKVGDQGTVIASDILQMSPIAGVDFVQGDFTEESVLEELLGLLGDRRADVVISDMTPNMSGMAAVDIPTAMGLVELALDMAQQVLRPGGVFVAKVFQRLLAGNRMLPGRNRARSIRLEKDLKADSCH